MDSGSDCGHRVNRPRRDVTGFAVADRRESSVHCTNSSGGGDPTDGETVELRDYWRVIRSHAWVIGLVTVVAMLTSGVLSYRFIRPTYQATATLIVLQRSNPSAAATNAADQQLYDTLSQTFADLATSPDVLRAAARQVGLPSRGLPATSVTATPVTGTNLITLQVNMGGAQLAAHVVDALSVALAHKVLSLEKVDMVALANRASVPQTPVSPRPKLNVAIAGVLGVLVGLALAFLLEYLDSTYHTADDVQRTFDVPVLGEIPIIDVPKKALVLHSQLDDREKVSL